jgi:hypothetical protein
LNYDLLPQTKTGDELIGYGLNPNRTSHLDDKVDVLKELGKSGSPILVLKVKTSNMRHLTTLPLTGGQGGDVGAERPVTQEGDPHLPRTSAEDAVFVSEQ